MIFLYRTSPNATATMTDHKHYVYRFKKKQIHHTQTHPHTILFGCGNQYFSFEIVGHQLRRKKEKKK